MDAASQASMHPGSAMSISVGGVTSASAGAWPSVNKLRIDLRNVAGTHARASSGSIILWEQHNATVREYEERLAKCEARAEMAEADIRRERERASTSLAQGWEDVRKDKDMLNVEKMAFLAEKERLRIQQEALGIKQEALRAEQEAFLRERAEYTAAVARFQSSSGWSV